MKKMAIKIENKFVIEDIENEKGEKIGEIKFNPNDSRIISKLSEIMNDLGKSVEQLKQLGTISEITESQLSTIDDFEKVSKDFEKINQAVSIEEKVIGNAIDNLSEIFGKETIELFTGRTYDIMALMPLIEFITPYVRNARQQKVDKYITKSNDGVMR